LAYASVSVRIEASIRDAFDFVADRSRLSEWYSHSVGEIIAFEQNKHIGFRGQAGSRRGDELFVFEGEGGSTQVTLVPMSNFSAGALDPNVVVSLRRLQELVEKHRISSPSGSDHSSDRRR
jgi:hypothetical protein